LKTPLAAGLESELVCAVQEAVHAANRKQSVLQSQKLSVLQTGQALFAPPPALWHFAQVITNQNFRSYIVQVAPSTLSQVIGITESNFKLNGPL
jgi:K+-transporting ATPase A subunit